MDLENQHMQCDQLTMHCLCSQGNHQPITLCSDISKSFLTLLNISNSVYIWLFASTPIWWCASCCGKAEKSWTSQVPEQVSTLHTGSTVLHGFLPLACLSCARPCAPHTPSADHDRLHGPAGLLRHHLGEGGGGGDCEAGEAGGGGGGDGGGQGARGFGARGFGWSEGPGSAVGHPALDRGSELSGGSIIFLSPMQCTNLFGLLILANLSM